MSGDNSDSDDDSEDDDDAVVFLMTFGGGEGELDNLRRLGGGEGPRRRMGEGERLPRTGDGDRLPLIGDGDRLPLTGDGDRLALIGDGDRLALQGDFLTNGDTRRRGGESDTDRLGNRLLPLGAESLRCLLAENLHNHKIITLFIHYIVKIIFVTKSATCKPLAQQTFTEIYMVCNVGLILVKNIISHYLL